MGWKFWLKRRFPRMPWEKAQVTRDDVKMFFHKIDDVDACVPIVLAHDVESEIVLRFVGASPRDTPRDALDLARCQGAMMAMKMYEAKYQALAEDARIERIGAQKVSAGGHPL